MEHPIEGHDVECKLVDCPNCTAKIWSCDTEHYMICSMSKRQALECEQDFSIPTFITKDSGQRKEFSSGMVRDVSGNKARYDLVYKPMLRRWAELMARGAVKYGERNWEKSSTEQELGRFLESANRHFEQWMAGERDEDHAAAVLFNISGAERLLKEFQLKWGLMK